MRGAKSEHEIAEAATQLRERLGCSSQYSIDLIKILEFQMDRLFPGFNLIVVEDGQLPSTVLALARGQPPEIIVRETIYEGALNQEPRARMVLAHEIGHLALGHTGIRARSPTRSIRSTVAEHEANRFAAFFLAPAHLAKDCKNAAEISARFGISRQAAEIRIQELNLGHKTGRSLPQSVLEFLSHARDRGYHISSDLHSDSDRVRYEEDVEDNPNVTSGSADTRRSKLDPS